MATTITKTKTGLNWGTNGITSIRNYNDESNTYYTYLFDMTDTSFKIKMMPMPIVRGFVISKATVIGSNATLIGAKVNFKGYSSNTRSHTISVWADGTRTSYANGGEVDSLSFSTSETSYAFTINQSDITPNDSGDYKIVLGAKGGILSNTAYFTNVSLDLIYTVTAYTLTVTAGTGGSVTAIDSEGNVFTDSKDIEENTAITLKAVANEEDNYKFLMWDDGNTDAARTVTVSADKTYTAIFEKLGADNTYTDGEKCSDVWIDGEKCSQLWIDGVKVFG